MNRVFLELAVLAALLLTPCVLGKASINPKLTLTKVSRKIDLSTQLAKVSSSVTLKNEGDSSSSYFLLAIEPSLFDKLAYASMTVSEISSDLYNFVLETLVFLAQPLICCHVYHYVFLQTKPDNGEETALTLQETEVESRR